MRKVPNSGIAARLTGCNQNEGGTSVGDTSVVGQYRNVGGTVADCLVDSHVPTGGVSCRYGPIQIRSAEVQDKNARR